MSATYTTTRALRCLAPGFPGYGHPDEDAYKIEQPAGATCTVTATESHGSAPWTRYSVVFGDGSRKYGVHPAWLVER